MFILGFRLQGYICIDKGFLWHVGLNPINAQSHRNSFKMTQRCGGGKGNDDCVSIHAVLRRQQKCVCFRFVLVLFNKNCCPLSAWRKGKYLQQVPRMWQFQYSSPWLDKLLKPLIAAQFDGQTAYSLNHNLIVGEAGMRTNLIRVTMLQRGNCCTNYRHGLGKYDSGEREENCETWHPMFMLTICSSIRTNSFLFEHFCPAEPRKGFLFVCLFCCFFLQKMKTFFICLSRCALQQEQFCIQPTCIKQIWNKRESKLEFDFCVVSLSNFSLVNWWITLVISSLILDVPSCSGTKFQSWDTNPLFVVTWKPLTKVMKTNCWTDWNQPSNNQHKWRCGAQYGTSVWRTWIG